MKHYLIYQITNTINQKIYIGKHETFNIDDDYFGSGKYLKRAIEKYGLENFTKTILIDLKNVEEMNLLEKMVVTAEFCAREDVYNINIGGDGGWHYVNDESDFKVGSNLRNEKLHKAGGKTCQEKYREKYGSFTKFCLDKMTEDQRSALHDKLSKNAKMSKFCLSFKGKHHSAETKEKISQSNKGCIPHNKGKIAVVDINTCKKQFVDTLDNLPSNLCLRSEYNEKKGIISKTAKAKKQRHIAAVLKHEKWLKETQEMADYYVQYGYEETCKKFDVHMSCESMLMRFIRARKKYGIKFESMRTSGHKREFKKINSNQNN